MDEVIAEDNRGVEVDFGGLRSKVDELEAGLRNGEASGEADIDEIIYKYFETMRDNFYSISTGKIELQKVNTGITGRIALSLICVMAAFALFDSKILGLIVCGGFLVAINHPFITGLITFITTRAIERNTNIDLPLVLICVGGAVLVIFTIWTNIAML